MKTKTIKMKIIKQSIVFDISPEKIYEMFLDSKKHGEMIGSNAKVSNKLGGSFSIWYGEITGKNLILIKDKKIVQSWRQNNWPKDYYSTVTLKFVKKGNRTKLILNHENVPETDYKDVKEGWSDYYWKPLKEMLKKN